MAKLDFDNLELTIKAQVLLNAGNIISQEVDFELPRGFIAKIKSYEFDVQDYHEDVEGITGAKFLGIHMALIRDPDDAVTTSVPVNQVQHDVVDQMNFSSVISNTAGVGWSAISAYNKHVDVNEETDIITARNMRFNAIGVGSQLADLTETFCNCVIKYTLEKVTDIDILNLLDIL